jgi:hypothetical protein
VGPWERVVKTSVLKVIRGRWLQVRTTHRRPHRSDSVPSISAVIMFGMLTVSQIQFSHSEAEACRNVQLQECTVAGMHTSRNAHFRRGFDCDNALRSVDLRTRAHEHTSTRAYEHTSIRAYEHTNMQPKKEQR